MEELGGLAQKSQRQPTPQEVVELLKQGVRPEELLKYGIPQELIQAAMQMLQQEMQMPTEGMGLADTAVMPQKEMVK